MNPIVTNITPAQRITVISATLLALFLGALDALVMSAAMPSIVADLGGMHLYSWVYSAYFLARAVSLPIFGKLADLYQNRHLITMSIGTFILASVGAGCAGNMTILIAFRIFQGIGAGGIFALTYIVLADISEPENRGRTLSAASSIWGIASIIGPTLGGFIVTYFSWRWIFFINVPIGLASLWGIVVYLVEVRPKKREVSLDFPGVAVLTTAILAFLFAFMLGGRNHAWGSPFIISLLTVAASGVLVFIRIERRAKDPILNMAFFRRRGFSAGNAAAFLCSMAIFSLFAFAPLFIQGVQGRSPMQVGLAMLSLSLGWSLSAMALGQIIDRAGSRSCAIVGALFLITGAALTLALKPESSVSYSFVIFFIVGMGMGIVSLATLLTVQASVDPKDLGVATSSNQFARTLGGTVGVGICGSFIATHFSALSEKTGGSGLIENLPDNLNESGLGRLEDLLDPVVQAAMTPGLLQMVHDAVGQGVTMVFWTVLVTSVLCLLCCLMLPGERHQRP
ncbi:MAG: MFS transporter [Desulfobacteraceae bacterium]|nr:MFS transporter [Desulfobacteraceae bacterium]